MNLEETAGAETPAADGAQPEATVDNSEATTTEQTATDTAAEQPDADGDDAAAAPRKKPGVHNRIDELTRQKHEALREAEYWRSKANEAKATPLEELDYDDQLVAKVKIADRQERAEAAERTASQVVQQQFSELESDARAKWADYDAVTRHEHLKITDAMAEIIMESEVGPEVAYHLGKNPVEATKIANMSERQMARELGRLEAKLTAPKALPKQPPAPVQPVNGIAAGGSQDPAGMSMSEYAAWRKANP